MNLAPDFDEVCGLLIAHGVEFVIVGAYALAFHGASRATGDLDFFVRPTEENGRRLIHAMAAFGFPTYSFSAADIARGDRVIQTGEKPVQILVMSDIFGASWDEVWNGSAPDRCGRHEVAFIGRDQFLAKQAAGRPQDLADVHKLEG
jgi:hypothetical protein